MLHTVNGKYQLIYGKCMDSEAHTTRSSPAPRWEAPSLNYALTVRGISIPEGWRTSEEAVMFINVQPAPWQHTSSNTINQPLTGDVHLSPLRVMEVSLWDNGAGERGPAIPQLKSVILRARCEPSRGPPCYLSPGDAAGPLLLAFSFNHLPFACGSDSVAPNHSLDIFWCLTNQMRTSSSVTSSSAPASCSDLCFAKTTKLMK